MNYSLVFTVLLAIIPLNLNAAAPPGRLLSPQEGGHIRVLVKNSAGMPIKLKYLGCKKDSSAFTPRERVLATGKTVTIFVQEGKTLRYQLQEQCPLYCTNEEDHAYFGKPSIVSAEILSRKRIEIVE